MRRSSSTVASKENPSSNSFSISNHFQSHDGDAFCYDKLESVHFESQELQTQIETIINRMKNDSNLQGSFRTEQGFLKVKKEDFISYYNGLRGVYKGIKKLCGDWDGLFDDFSTKHSQSIAKKNKEMESLVKHFRYKLKALEFEKKSALEEQKSDLLRREQEVLDTVNSFINSLKGTKKSWENNLNELHFCVQEHAQTIDYLVSHKSARLDAFSSEIDSLFADAPPLSQRTGTLNSQRSGIVERQKEYPNRTKQPLTDLINILSPITQEIQIPKMDIPLSDKSKEDPNSLTSKRGKDLSTNSIDELFMFNKGDHGQSAMQENSRFSGGKEEGGWDSNLDDEDEENEKVDVEQIEKALELLFQNGMLDSHAINMYEQIIENTEESGVDREIQMNLFKDHIKLQLKRQKNDNNENISLKKTNKIGAQCDTTTKGSPPVSAFRRKALDGPSVTRGREHAHENKIIKKTTDILPTDIQTQKDLHIREKAGKKKHDVSLSDLLKVKDYSFVLESPLSTHPNREEHSIHFPPLQHAQKEDLLQADSLPVTLREAEISRILAEKRRLNMSDDDIDQSSLMENTKKKDKSNSDDKQRKNHYSLKVIEESKTSTHEFQTGNSLVCRENRSSSEESHSSVSAKRNFFHQEEPSFVLAATVVNKKENVISDPYQSSGAIINTEGNNTISPQKIKVMNVNTADIKLASIENYPELGGRTGYVKETHQLRKLANKNSLRNSHLTGSTNMRVSTKANTGFNDGETYSTANVRLTMYSSIDQTQPTTRAPYKHSASGIVEMKEDTNEKAPVTFLSQTFPPYTINKEKEDYSKSPKVHGNNTSLREITNTTDSRWHSKEITPYNGIKDSTAHSTFRGNKDMKIKVQQDYK